LDTCITVWHLPKHLRWYDEGMRETLGWVREAGFTHINWNPDAGSSYMLARAEIDFTAKMVRESGLKVKSLHASNGRNPVSEVRNVGNPTPAREDRKDIGSSHEWQRQSGVELLQNRIELAAAFGSPDAILHVDITDDVFRSAETEEAFFGPFWRSLDALQPFCVERGIKIAVETLTGASAENWIRLYDLLFERYRSDFIGLCLDIGHWHMVAGDDLSILERHGDRLIATHIHDNFGATDDHLLPFNGRINWQATTRAIAATPCQMPVNLETPQDRHTLPELPFYKRAHKVAVTLEQMVADARARSK
jgi:sugar phosphate isomerase/epimerase